MILKEIYCKDFRQFYGNVGPIKFSTNKEKNVTVIHAENGSGKTTFLHMLIWCLYNELDLPQNTLLLNERKLAELDEFDETEVFVKLVLEDAGVDYVITRIKKYNKKNGNQNYLKTEFFIEYKNENGETTFVEGKEADFIVERLLPSSMKEAFFLDKERVDTLSKLDNPEAMKNATHTILKLQEYENAINDLKSSISRLKSDARKYKNNVDLLTLLDKKANHEKRKQQADTYINQCKNNIKALELEKKTLDTELAGINEIKAKVQERKNIEEKIKFSKEKIVENEKKDNKNISENGYFLFLDDLYSDIENLVKVKRKTGELPSKIKQPFIEELLEKKECICGSLLEEGTENRKKLLQLLKESTSSDLDTAFQDLSTYLKVAKKSINKYEEQAKSLKSDEIKFKLEIRALEEKLQLLNKELENVNGETGNIQMKRDECIKKQAHFERDLTKYIASFNADEKSIKELDLEIDKVLKNDKAYAEVENQINFISDIQKHLVKMQELKKSYSKEKLQNKITEIFNKFTRKGYKPIISDEFTVKVVKDNNGQEKEVAMSSGERGVTSISFIGALTDVVRNESEIMDDKKVYPIVLDSPFGELDLEHRKEVALGLPHLAEQIIILVSDSQWNGAVENNISDNLGKKYRITNFNKKKNPDISGEYSLIERDDI